MNVILLYLAQHLDGQSTSETRHGVPWRRCLGGDERRYTVRRSGDDLARGR